MPKPSKLTKQAVANAIRQLVEGDSDVTVRAVARLVDVAPSTISRYARDEVEKGADDQVKIRAIAAASKVSREALLARIETRDEEITVLERRIQILIASHRALLMAVGEIGGMASWQRFFARYDSVRRELHSLGAISGSELLGTDGDQASGHQE